MTESIQFTQAQIDTLLCFAQGDTLQEVGGRRGVSERTAINEISDAHKKLRENGIPTNRIGTIEFAIETEQIAFRQLGGSAKGAFFLTPTEVEVLQIVICDKKVNYSEIQQKVKQIKRGTEDAVVQAISDKLFGDKTVPLLGSAMFFYAAIHAEKIFVDENKRIQVVESENERDIARPPRDIISRKRESTSVPPEKRERGRRPKSLDFNPAILDPQTRDAKLEAIRRVKAGEAAIIVDLIEGKDAGNAQMVVHPRLLAVGGYEIVQLLDDLIAHAATVEIKAFIERIAREVKKTANTAEAVNTEVYVQIPANEKRMYRIYPIHGVERFFLHEQLVEKYKAKI